MSFAAEFVGGPKCGSFEILRGPVHEFPMKTEPGSNFGDFQLAPSMDVHMGRYELRLEPGPYASNPVKFDWKGYS